MPGAPRARPGQTSCLLGCRAGPVTRGPMRGTIPPGSSSTPTRRAAPTDPTSTLCPSSSSAPSSCSICLSPSLWTTLTTSPGASFSFSFSYSCSCSCSCFFSFYFSPLFRDSSILGSHHLGEFITAWADFDPSGLYVPIYYSKRHLTNDLEAS